MAQATNQPTDAQLKQQAKKNIIKRTLLSVDAVSYIFVNVLLFIINYFTNYDYRWHYWALIGWGAALILHAIIYTMPNMKGKRGATKFILFHLVCFILGNAIALFTNVFNGSSLSNEITWYYYVLGGWISLLLTNVVMYIYIMSQKAPTTGKIEDWKTFQNRIGIGSNILAYIFINISAFFINQWVDDSYLWFYWVLTGWGLALALSLVAYSVGKAKEKSTHTKLITMHTGLYVLVNIFLVFVNFFDGQTLSFTGTTAWVLYVVGFWGIGYVLHLMYYQLFRKSMDEKIDAELQKINP